MKTLIYAQLDAGAALLPMEAPVALPATTPATPQPAKGEADEPLPMGGATPADLEAINALPQVLTARQAAGLAPLTADDVFVRSFYVLNDQPWKDGQFRIATKALAAAPALFVGKPVMVNHAKGSGDTPLGHWFRGDLVPQADGSLWASSRMYVDRIESNRDVMMKLNSGAISQVSAGVLFDGLVCSIDNEDLDWSHEHMPGEDYGDQGRAYGLFPKIEDIVEVSLCWAGMIAGTRMSVPMGRDRALSIEQFMASMAATRLRERGQLLTPEQTLTQYMEGDGLGNTDTLDQWLKGGSPAP